MLTQQGTIATPATTAVRPNASERVLLVGYGDAAQEISDVLLRRGAYVVVIERDATLAALARARGCQVRVGDARHPDVLRQAAVESAGVVAITTRSPDESVLRAIRTVRPEGVILTRLPTGFDADDSANPTRMLRRIVRLLQVDAKETIS